MLKDVSNYVIFLYRTFENSIRRKSIMNLIVIKRYHLTYLVMVIDLKYKSRFHIFNLVMGKILASKEYFSVVFSHCLYVL